MSIPAKKIEKTQKHARKQQPTEKQKNIKYQNVNLSGAGFYIQLATEAARPLPPVSYATASEWRLFLLASSVGHAGVLTVNAALVASQ